MKEHRTDKSYKVEEGFKKKCGFIHISFSPTHPPINVDKNKKKHVVFWGFLAHLEQKKIMKFFHVATHHCHPMEPSTATINCRHPSTPPTTNVPNTTTHHCEWCSGRCCCISGGWVVAVGVRGGGWVVFLAVVCVGGNSGDGL